MGEPSVQMMNDDVTELRSLAAGLKGHLLRVRAGRVPAPRVGLALADVRAELGDCKRCKLHPMRTNLVFGVGNPHAELVFIGEAPGEKEDLKGEPFVGEAGQLLTKMIEAMGLRREDVYIANTLKCLRYNTLVLLENGSWERIGR